MKSNMKTNRVVSVLGAISCSILCFTGNSFAVGLSNEPRIGEHFKVIPAANGTNEITLVANGLNYQDTNGNWIESIPIVQNFSSGIVCTGASYQVILATNLNSYGSVDLELPADPATGVRGRMLSHPLGIAFYDPDSGATVLLAQLKDCSAQIVSNKVIFADAFAGSNGIQGAISYTYGVGHFHQDVTLTARPSVTPADFGMGPNARLEVLTEFEQSPEPVVTENTVSAGTSSTLSATTAQAAAEPVLNDQTLDYGTMQMGRGRAFSTPAASPLNALMVTKQLVSVENRNFLTEDVPWDKAAEALQNLPSSSDGTNNSPPQASSRHTMPRQQMIAQLSAHRPATNVKTAKSFKERLAAMQRLAPPKLASLNPQLLGAPKHSDGGPGAPKRSDGGSTLNSQFSTLNSPSGFVMDYELVQTCDYYTFQSGHTYLIGDYVQLGSGEIQSGAVIKFSGGDLEILWAISCPSSDPKAVLTDMNDNSVGAGIPGSVGHFTTCQYYCALNLEQLDAEGYWWPYVQNLDIRYANIGVNPPSIEGNGCYVFDCWFFDCSYGIAGGPDSIILSGCDFCQVNTPYPSDMDPYYLNDITYCSVDRNGNGLADSWEFQYFASLTHLGSELDASGHTLLYDYQHFSNFPSIAISAPANNSSITTTRVNVTGTFVEPFLKQITVNGVTAFINGNSFEALNVPLKPGANTVIATIEESSVAGIFNNIAQTTATASITVNGSSTPVDPVQLTATPLAGFAPLSVSFQITANAPGAFQQVLYDFNGDGVTDQTANNLNSISHTYSDAGEYFPVVTVVTSSGRSSSPGGWSSGDPNRLRINVQTPPVLQSASTISVTDPVDLKTTASGNLYVLSGSTATIREYDSGGNLIRSLAGIGTSPSGLDVDSAGNVYVAVTGDNQVLKFSPATSSFQLDTTFGTNGRIGKSDKSLGLGNGEFNSPFDIAVSPDGSELTVSDSGNDRIQQFSISGAFRGSFGQQGNAIGQFNTPKGLAYDNGYLYVVDSINNRIALAVSGIIVGTSGAGGSDFGQFQGAVNLGVGSRGIYVADSGNNRVQVFSPITGPKDSLTPFALRGALSTEIGLNHPKAVAAVSSPATEVLYIADTGNDRVLLVTLPLDDVTPVWNNMKQALLSGNVNGASQYFSKTSSDKYKQAFLSMPQTALNTIVSQIPALTPVEIKSDTAEYRFDRTIRGVILTFPVDFAKENGVWKIIEF
jgi:hypothetical protein